MAKIQAAVLVPLFRALRKELGIERATQIVSDALRGWSREIYRKIGEQIQGRPADSRPITGSVCLFAGAATYTMAKQF